MKKLLNLMIVISVGLIASNSRADDVKDQGFNHQQFSWSPGLNIQLDKFTAKSGVATIIAYMPEEIVNNDAPPFWMRLCRNSSTNGNTIVRVDKNGNSAGFSNKKCMYVAFKQSVAVETDLNDAPEIEMQFLGRY